MAKKLDEEVMVDEVAVAKPALLTNDFQRDDLNELRDAVNYLLGE